MVEDSLGIAILPIGTFFAMVKLPLSEHSLVRQLMITGVTHMFVESEAPLRVLCLVVGYSFQVNGP